MSQDDQVLFQEELPNTVPDKLNTDKGPDKSDRNPIHDKRPVWNKGRPW